METSADRKSRLFGIESPLRRSVDVERLVDAGANGFYGGLLDPHETLRNTSLSHRQGPFANFLNEEDLGIAVEKAHRCGVSFHLTLNARLLVLEDEPRFLRQLDVARALDVDGIIVSNHPGLLLARERLPEAHLVASLNFGIMNAAAARTLAALGVRRIVAPRHLVPEEIACLARAVPEVEIEAVIFNVKCAYHDAFCGYHYDSIRGKDWTNQGCTAVADCRVPRMRPTACGVCALPLLAGSVSVLKVVGRDMNMDFIARDVAFLDRLRTLLAEGCDPRDFPRQARTLYREHFGVSCGNDCYYERMHP